MSDHVNQNLLHEAGIFCGKEPPASSTDQSCCEIIVYMYVCLGRAAQVWESRASWSGWLGSGKIACVWLDLVDLGKSSLGNFTTAGPRPATACQANTTHSSGGEGRQDQGKRRRCPNMSWLLRILTDTQRHTEIHRHIETHRHIQRATQTQARRADCTELDA